jgi:hypothetical protein
MATTARNDLHRPGDAISSVRRSWFIRFSFSIARVVAVAGYAANGLSTEAVLLRVDP